jgi:hypothetical protein
VAQYQERREQVPKKAYKSPEFTVYGAIVKLTQSGHPTGRLDGNTVVGRKHT